MVVLLYDACRFSLLGAAAGAVVHYGYVCWKHRDGRLPLAKDSADEAVAACAIGAAVGQFVVGVPILFFAQGVSVQNVVLSELAVLPFMAPLYVPAMFPKGRRWVSQQVPYLIGGSAAMTAIIIYMFRFTTFTGTWAMIWLTTACVGLNNCGLLVFLFSHRYNSVILHLTRQLQDQGIVIPCGTLLPTMHMVFGDILALLLVLEASGVMFMEWWVLCTLTIAAAPALPNVLTQHNQRPVDLEMAIWVHFGAMGAIFILTLMFPEAPAAWAIANQLWVCHAQDWKSLGSFEEECRAPPSYPFQELLGRQMQGPGHRLDGAESPSAFSSFIPGFGGSSADKEQDAGDGASPAASSLTEEERREIRARAAEERMKSLHSLEQPE